MWTRNTKNLTKSQCRQKSSKGNKEPHGDASSESRTRFDFRVTWSPMTAAGNCLWKRSRGNFYSKPKLPPAPPVRRRPHGSFKDRSHPLLNWTLASLRQWASHYLVNDTMKERRTHVKKMHDQSVMKSSNLASHKARGAWHQLSAEAAGESTNTWHLPRTIVHPARKLVGLAAP